MSICVKTGLDIWLEGRECGWHTDAHYIATSECLIFTGCTGDREFYGREDHGPIDLVIAQDKEMYTGLDGTLVVPASHCVIQSKKLYDFWKIWTPELLFLIPAHLHGQAPPLTPSQAVANICKVWNLPELPDLPPSEDER